MNIGRCAEKPIKDFLNRHAKLEDKDLFLSIMNSGGQAEKKPVLSDDFIILAPAFSDLSIKPCFPSGLSNLLTIFSGRHDGG